MAQRPAVRSLGCSLVVASGASHPAVPVAVDDTACRLTTMVVILLGGLVGGPLLVLDSAEPVVAGAALRGTDVWRLPLVIAAVIAGHRWC